MHLDAFSYAELDMEAWLYLSKTPANLACLSPSGQRPRLYAMVAGLVSALAALHRDVGGFVASHHDLKPRNILVMDGELLIADLGMSRLLRLGRTGGSGVSAAGGLGTKSYRPPEYHKEDSWERDESRVFGRAFDMWAMGCIMIQVAVLLAWGWESDKMREFRGAREIFVAQLENQWVDGGAGKGRPTPDDSFVKSIPKVDEWLTLLQQSDGSAMLRGYLGVAIQMLRPTPLDRIHSWEAELDLHELLHPDETWAARLAMTADLAQKPTPAQAADGVETPLHRAVMRGHLLRVVGLLEAGWSMEQIDRMGRACLEIASQNGHSRLHDFLSRAAGIQKLGGHRALRDAALEPAIQVKDQRGFHLLEGSWYHRVGSRVPQGEIRGDAKGSASGYGKHDAGYSPAVLGHSQNFGRTQLHVAAQRGDMAMLTSLLHRNEASQAIVLADDLGMTPLHYAAGASAGGSAAILRAATQRMQLLLARDQYGRNPLHLAAEVGNRDVVRVLLEACGGSEECRRMLYQEDQEGMTPLDRAEAIGRLDIVQICEEALVVWP